MLGILSDTLRSKRKELENKHYFDGLNVDIDFLRQTPDAEKFKLIANMLSTYAIISNSSKTSFIRNTKPYAVWKYS